jgi:hypothetical protein
VAEGARRALAAHRQHPAVGWAQTLAATGEGGLSALFANALAVTWPGEMAAHVADFEAVAQPEVYWAETEADWQAALADLQVLVASAGLGEFLADFLGALPGALVVYPNLLYPGYQAVAASGEGELVLSQPPPPAWGASTPWRYGERPDEVLASLAEGFARGLLTTALPEPLPALAPLDMATLPVAVAVLYLRQAEGAAAAAQFMLVEQRMRGLPRLGAMVGALEGRRGLAEVAEALNSLES